MYDIMKYNDDYYTSLKKDYISSSDESAIIPIPSDDGTVSYCVIPSSNNSMFSTSVKIKETKSNLMVEPFDWIEELDDAKNFNNLTLASIISETTELTEDQKIGENFKYCFNHEDKVILKDLLSKSNFNPDELLTFVIEVLETYPLKLIETKNGYSYEKLTESDVLTMLKTLTIKTTHFEQIVEIISTMDNVDFETMSAFIYKKTKLLDFFETFK